MSLLIARSIKSIGRDSVFEKTSIRSGLFNTFVLTGVNLAVILLTILLVTSRGVENSMKKLMGITSMLVAALWTLPVQAHHSFSATFTDEVITVNGIVTDMKFVNPHVNVYFDVTDENGDVTEWVSEGDSATSLRTDGWSSDSLESGDYISITGNSSRNGSPMVSMEEINLVNPRTGALLGPPGDEEAAQTSILYGSQEMTLPDGRPSLSGTWYHNIPEAIASRGKNGWPGGFLNDDEPQYTAEGAALQAAFTTADDPQVQCVPPGLVRQAGHTPHPFTLQQFEDRIELVYEEYGGKRTVYFDDRDLVGGDVSRFGQSIARYEGDTLVIETTHVEGALASPIGIALSDQTTTKEVFSRSVSYTHLTLPTKA